MGSFVGKSSCKYDNESVIYVCEKRKETLFKSICWNRRTFLMGNFLPQYFKFNLIIIFCINLDVSFTPFPYPRHIRKSQFPFGTFSSLRKPQLYPLSFPLDSNHEIVLFLVFHQNLFHYTLYTFVTCHEWNSVKIKSANIMSFYYKQAFNNFAVLVYMRGWM